MLKPRREFVIFFISLALFLLQTLVPRILIYSRVFETIYSTLPVMLAGYSIGPLLCLKFNTQKMPLIIFLLIIFAPFLFLISFSLGLPYHIIIFLVAILFGIISFLLFDAFKKVPFHFAYFFELIGAVVGTSIGIFALSSAGAELLLVIASCCIFAGLISSGIFQKRKCIFASIFILLSFILSLQIYKDSFNLFRLLPLSESYLKENYMLAHLQKEKMNNYMYMWDHMGRIDSLTLHTQDEWDNFYPKDLIPSAKDHTILFHDNIVFSKASKIHLKWTGKYYQNMVREEPKILIVGGGGGDDVIYIKRKIPNADIDLVEINKSLVRIMQEENLKISEHAYNKAQVIIADGTHYLFKSSKKYDVIDLDLIESYIQLPHMPASIESYLLTEESFMQIINSLSSEGIFYLTFTYQTNLLTSQKLLATILTTLIKNKYDPKNSIVLIDWNRGMKLHDRGLMYFLVKPKGFSQGDLNSIDNLISSSPFNQIRIFPPSTSSLSNHFLATLINKSTNMEQLEANNTNAYGNVSPATFNKPYFFSFADRWFWFHFNLVDWFFIILQIILIFLCCKCFVKDDLRKDISLSKIGIIFMTLLPISSSLWLVILMQKSILYYALPTWSWAAVSLSFLLGSSLGSLSSKFVSPKQFIILSFLTLFSLILSDYLINFLKSYWILQQYVIPVVIGIYGYFSSATYTSYIKLSKPSSQRLNILLFLSTLGFSLGAFISIKLSLGLGFGILEKLTALLLLICILLSFPLKAKFINVAGK